MAEIVEQGGSKQKKSNARVDFTPMVDMLMLLITFFMLATSLSKPQTMELTMPSNDNVQKDQQTEAKASEAITIYVAADNKIYYGEGEPQYGIQGRVTISFVVERDGSITDVKVARSVDPSLDKEAARVVSSMPRWTPGKQNGSAVRVKFNVPVVFKLQQ